MISWQAALPEHLYNMSHSHKPFFSVVLFYLTFTLGLMHQRPTWGFVTCPRIFIKPPTFQLIENLLYFLSCSHPVSGKSTPKSSYSQSLCCVIRVKIHKVNSCATSKMGMSKSFITYCQLWSEVGQSGPVKHDKWVKLQKKVLIVHCPGHCSISCNSKNIKFSLINKKNAGEKHSKKTTVCHHLSIT